MNLTGTVYSIWILILATFLCKCAHAQDSGCYTGITLDDEQRHELTPTSGVGLCEWGIDVRKYHQNLTIHLELDLSVQTTAGCTDEYVKITSNTSELVVACGTKVETHEFFIDFVTISFKKTRSASTFTLAYQMKEVSECSGQYSGTGVIQAPVNETLRGGWVTYKNYQRCTYFLYAKDQILLRMKLTVKVDRDSPSSPCGRGYVEVYTGASTKGTLLGHYCMYSESYDFPGFHDQFYVVYVVGENSVDNLGFNIDYQEDECSDVIEVPTSYATVDFPGTDSFLTGSHDLQCRWRLRTLNENWRVVLSFNDVSMDCTAGNLIKVYDGDSGSPRSWSFCEGPRHLYLSSTYNVNVHLNISADNIDTVRFKMSYISTTEQVCGKNMPDMTTTAYIHELKSPLYPDTYPDFTECVWHIKAPVLRDKIKVILNGVHLDAGCNDFLQIYNGIEDDFSKDAAVKFCGDNTFINKEFVSDGANITIRFKSDATGGGKGWLLTYQTLEIDLPVAPITAEEGVNGAAIGAGVGITLVVLLVVAAVVVICVMRNRWRKERANRPVLNPPHLTPGDPSALGPEHSSGAYPSEFGVVQSDSSNDS